MSHHIKTADGYDVKVPSQGQVDYNSVAGSLGLASFAGLNLGNILGGWNNRTGMCATNPAEVPVTRYEFGLEKEIAAKDSEIALLKANTYNDGKMLELYRYIDGKFAIIEAWKAEQAVRNQGVADAFREMQKDVDYKVALEAERRNCADEKIANYVNSTFAPKLIADYTAGTTTAVANVYNPLCGCYKPM